MSMFNSRILPEQEKLKNIELYGNINPHNWCHIIKTKSGRADYNTISLLAEIMYWYRPTPVMDENSEQIISWKKKFKNDALQKSYEELEKSLNLSKAQLRHSIYKLEELGFISREFRQITIGGATYSNVMYLHLNIEKVLSITNYYHKQSKKIYSSQGIAKQNRGYSSIKQDVYKEHSKQKLYSSKSSNPENLSSASKNENQEKEENKNKLDKNSENINSQNIAQQLLDIWNEVIELPNNNKSLELNNSLKWQLLNCFKQNFETLENWKKYCHTIASSKFLMGEKSEFRAKLNWVIKEEVIDKIREGFYGIGDRELKTEKDTNNEVEQFISNQSNSKWQEILRKLQNRYGDKTFLSWFTDIKLSEITSEVDINGYDRKLIKLNSASKFKAEWIRDNFLGVIERGMANYYGNCRCEIGVEK